MGDEGVKPDPDIGGGEEIDEPREEDMSESIEDVGVRTPGPSGDAGEYENSDI